MINRPIRIALLITGFIVVVLLFFLRLDAMGLTGPDEPRYAEVAKEMLLSHDYITPRLLGQPWFEKPVLYYWSTALAYSHWGVNETAARLPSAVAAFLLTLTLLLAPRPILNFESRGLSSLIFATSLGGIVFSRAASTDMLLTATFSIAMILFWVVLQDPATTQSNLRVVLAYLALGLSVLAKGPVGVVLAAAILFCYFWISGEWKKIGKLKIPLGIALMAAVDLPWFLLCYRANGWVFIDTFLVRHNLLRFATNDFQHWRPFWFYIPVILGALLPWSFFLLLTGSRVREFLNLGTWRIRPHRTFLALWVVIPLLFFTIAQSKLPGYILPVLVPLSIILANSLIAASHPSPMRETRNQALRSFRWALGLELLFFAFLLISSHRITSRFQLALGGLEWVIGITASLMIVVLICCLFHPRGLFIALGSHVLIMAALVIVATLRILPHLDPEISVRPAVQALHRISGSPRVFVFEVSRSVRYGLDFYLTPPPVPVNSPQDISHPRSQSNEFLVISTRAPKLDAIHAAFPGEVIYQSREIVVWRMGAGPE
jgi:4-amino-4-deoxy-L-arabinose transferase-like glycosyltransferase